MPTVLITGGAGFIGSHLVDLHLERGDEVLALDNLSTGSAANLAHRRGHPRLEFHKGSMQDYAGLSGLVARADRVYHLAAAVGVRQVLKSPLNVLDSNIYSTSRLFRALIDRRKGARVIVASSSEVYGLRENVPFKETDDLILPSRDPLRWCYSITKLAGEMLAYAYSHEHGMNATAVRLFNTVGLRQSPDYGMVLPNFVARAVRGEDLMVSSDGRQTRAFCDVRDTVAAIALVADCSLTTGEIVNIGSEREISIGELAERVVALAGSRSRIVHKTYEEAYGHAFVDSRRRCADTSKLRALTGFSPRYTLDETILSLIAAARTPA